MAAMSSHTVSAIEALRFSVLFASVAAACVAIGFLLSTVMAGEHTAIAAAALLPFVHLAVVNQPVLRNCPAMNLFNVMTGNRMAYLDRTTGFIAWLPWPLIGTIIVIAAAALALGIFVGERHDF